MRIVVIAMSVLLGMAQARVWYVHPDSTLNTIQAGLNACSANDTVLVGPGTYVENIIWPTTQGIDLVSEYGPDTTIIDGDSAGMVILMNTGMDTTTTIEGFTIQKGYNSAYGAGIRCSGTSVKITGNIIKDNVAGIAGAGIYLVNSSSIITGNTITHNKAGTGSYGGGIYSYNSTCKIIGNAITYNKANQGGGIECDSCRNLIKNNVIMADTAVYNGGGIACYWYDSSTIDSNIITLNNCINNGGGISCLTHSTPILTRNMITENGPSPCFTCWQYSSPTVIDCDIENNTGYGLFIIDHCSPLIANCRIAGNIDIGVYCGNQSIPNIHNCEITANVAYGVYNQDEMVVVDADSNWWGDTTGPYHPTLNPGGLGDRVSDYVDFIPWLLWSGVEERPVVNPVVKGYIGGATIFRGPLRLPAGTSCRIFDITGRVVMPNQIKPGVYFIEVDGQIVKKIIKVR